MRCDLPRGFIALFSVLAFSAVLLLLASVADYAAYLAHEAIIDERSYRNAQQATLSCALFAMSRLDADPLRFVGAGTTTVQFSENRRCEIVSASSTDNSASALTQGDSNDSSVRMYSTAARSSSTAPFVLRTWTEY